MAKERCGVTKASTLSERDDRVRALARTIAPGARTGDELHIVVMYDIRKPSRLKKVAKELEGFGERMQYSVFECRLTPEGLDELLVTIDRLILQDVDSVRYYFLCAKDNVVIVGAGGGADLPEADDYAII